MKNHILKLLAISVGIFTISSGHAQIISVNFSQFATGELASSTSAGVVPAINWNNFTYGSLGTSLLSNSGAATTANLTVANNVFVGWYGDVTGDGTLAQAALRASSSSQSATTTIDFTGISYSNYDVIVYLTTPTNWGASGMRQASTLTSMGFTTTTYYTATQNYLTPNTWVQSSSTNGTFDAGSYVRFSGLTNSAFSLLTTYTTSSGAGATDDSGIAGLQIVNVIPEPTSLALLVGGLATLVILRCRLRDIRGVTWCQVSG